MASKTKVRANQVRIEEILNDPSAIATTTKAGTLRIATQAEVTAGTANNLAVTPATLDNWTFANDGSDFSTKPATSGANAISIGHSSLSYSEAVAQEKCPARTAAGDCYPAPPYCSGGLQISRF